MGYNSTSEHSLEGQWHIAPEIEKVQTWFIEQIYQENVAKDQDQTWQVRREVCV
jgi:hypothetical protein